MKETKIAKENVDAYKYSKDLDAQSIFSNVSLEHKQVCQRWLEFLDELINLYCDEGNTNDDWFNILNKKRIDLKQVIKLYKDAGI